MFKLFVLIIILNFLKNCLSYEYVIYNNIITINVNSSKYMIFNLSNIYLSDFYLFDEGRLPKVYIPPFDISLECFIGFSGDLKIENGICNNCYTSYSVDYINDFKMLSTKFTSCFVYIKCNCVNKKLVQTYETDCVIRPYYKIKTGVTPQPKILCNSVFYNFYSLKIFFLIFLITIL